MSSQAQHVIPELKENPTPLSRIFFPNTQQQTIPHFHNPQVWCHISLRLLALSFSPPHFWLVAKFWLPPPPLDDFSIHLATPQFCPWPLIWFFHLPCTASNPSHGWLPESSFYCTIPILSSSTQKFEELPIIYRIDNEKQWYDLSWLATGQVLPV